MIVTYIFWYIKKDGLKQAKGDIVQGKNLEKFLTTSEDDGSKIKVRD